MGSGEGKFGEGKYGKGEMGIRKIRSGKMGVEDGEGNDEGKNVEGKIGRGRWEGKMGRGRREGKTGGEDGRGRNMDPHRTLQVDSDSGVHPSTHNEDRIRVRKTAGKNEREKRNT